MKKNIIEAFNDPKASYFLFAILIFGVSSGVFMGVLNNYLHEVLNISKVERGLVEFPRELPGLLLILIIAALHNFSETRILRLAFFVALLGVAGIVLGGASRTIAIFMIVLWSAGEHIIMPVRQSIGLHMAKSGKEGLALGTVRGMTNIGQVFGYYLIPTVFLLLPFAPQRGTFPYFRLAFILAGIALLAGFILTSILEEKGRHVRRQRLYFRKKYSKYYILEVFFGARKQVFLTFAPFVLVLNYHIQTETLALLYGLTATINIFVGPLVGQLIDRIGYRLVIIVDTVLLVLLCFLYGFTHHFVSDQVAFYVICGVFVLDAVLFVVTMARTIYIRTIADSKEEITATLSTGISINHMISIVIAIFGGILWYKLGIEVLFSMAALFGVGSFLFALTLPSGKRAEHSR